MVAVLQRHDIGWLAPAPTWHRAGDLTQVPGRQRLLRPTIMRFADDSFMEQLLALLAYYPESLAEWEARAETWERPMATPATAAHLPPHEPVSQLSTRLKRLAVARGFNPSANGERAPVEPLKLYQPIHKRHYLVTASLVCRRAGLPDRRPDAGRQERVAFVLRRVVPATQQGVPAADPNDWQEYAYVTGPDGSRWQSVTSGQQSATRLLDGEERLPMFGLGFDDERGHRRQLFAGTVPVARREAYLAAPLAGTGAATGGAPAELPADPRLMLFQLRVTGPWSELVLQALDDQERFTKAGTGDSDIEGEIGGAPSPLPDRTLDRSRDQIQTISWYVLLDCVQFFRDHAPRIGEVLAGQRDRDTLDAATEEPLLAWLEEVVLVGGLAGPLAAGPDYAVADVRTNLLAALMELATNEALQARLDSDQVEVEFRRASRGHWPEFLFPLAEPRALGPFPFVVQAVNLSGNPFGREITLQRVGAALAELEARVQAALPPSGGAPAPEIPIPDRVPGDVRDGWFAIRCVYERPNCGPRAETVLSEPTVPFQMAGFFDPEAPARPIRIPMPFDISPAGLRKYNKSATLMISDALCGQLKRIRKMSLGDLVLSVLPWPFHKDLPDPSAGGPCRDGSNPLGMFCSLSIPIVTICALILLIIMVSLFDMIFRWLPYLFVCLPIPGLKGKKP